MTNKNNNLNSVSLIGWYGGDNRHALSAWQSTNIESDIPLSDDVQLRIKQLTEATAQGKQKSIPDLLRYLAHHGHISPFRKSYLDFQVTGDLASHVHCLKHSVGVEINSESARYKELEDKWYLPFDWDNQFPVENGAYALSENFIWQHECTTWSDVLDAFCKLGHQLYHHAVRDLTATLGRKRAKESARFFLPYAKQLDYDMQFSFQAFVHFQKLRNNFAAQKEIQIIANEMLKLVKEIPGNPFRYSLEAFDL